MSRDLNDPRVAEVMAILDEHLAYQAEDRKHSGGEVTHEGAVDGFVSHDVIGQGTYDHWPDDAVRGIVRAFAEHAPPDVFRELLARVRKSRKSIRAHRAEAEREVWPAMDARRDMEAN